MDRGTVLGDKYSRLFSLSLCKHISIARALHVNFNALKFRGDLYGETATSIV